MQFVAVPPVGRSRVLGTVMGAAVGDALGHPTEFLRSFAAMHAKYPPPGLQASNSGGSATASVSRHTQTTPRWPKSSSERSQRRAVLLAR